MPVFDAVIRLLVVERLHASMLQSNLEDPLVGVTTSRARESHENNQGLMLSGLAHQPLLTADGLVVRHLERDMAVPIPLLHALENWSHVLGGDAQQRAEFHRVGVDYHLQPSQ